MKGLTPKQMIALGTWLMLNADKPPATLRLMLHEMPTFARPIGEVLFAHKYEWRAKGFAMKQLGNRMIRQAKQETVQ